MKHSLWTRSVSLLLAVLMVLAIPAAAVEVQPGQEEAGETAVVQDPQDESQDLAEEDTPEEPAENTPPEQPQEEKPVYLDQEGNYLAPEVLVVFLAAYADGRNGDENKAEKKYTGVVAFYDYNEQDTEKMLKHPYFFYYQEGVLQDEKECFASTDTYLNLTQPPIQAVTLAGDGDKEQANYLAQEVYVDQKADSHPEYLFVFNRDQVDNGLFTGSEDSLAYVDGLTPVVELTGLTQDENGQPVLTWEKLDGAQEYQIYRRSSEDEAWKLLDTVDGAVTSYTDQTQVAEGTAYDYQVRGVYSGGGLSADGRSVMTFTARVTPTVTIKVPTALQANGIQVSWSKDTGATGYRVLRKAEDAQDWTVVKDLGKDETTWQDAGAVSDTTYTYAVRAYYGSKSQGSWESDYTLNVWSEAGESNSLYYLAAPEIQTVYCTSTGMTVTWSAVPGATTYYVYQKSTASGSVWERRGTVSSSTRSFNIVGLVDGSSHYYTVRAGNSKLAGPYIDYSTDPLQQVTFHQAPTITTSSTADGVKVSWSRDAAATGYRILRKISGETSWSDLVNVTSGAGSYVDESAPSGVTCYYAIRAYYGDVDAMAGETNYTTGLWSGCTVATGLFHLSAPELTSVYSTSTGMAVTWSAVPGATEYYVYKKTDDAGAVWVRQAKVSASTRSYIITDVEKGEECYYTVKAGKGTIYGPYVDTSKDTANLVLYHGAPTIQTASTVNGIQVTWSKEAGATGYMLQRKVSGETEWTTIARYTSGATTSYTETAAESGKTYYYAIRAYFGPAQNAATDDDFTSNLWSGCKVAAGLFHLSAPELNNIYSTSTGMAVTWSAVPGATEYYVYKKTAETGAVWVRQAKVSGSTRSYIITDVEPGEQCYYTVKAGKGTVYGPYNDTSKDVNNLVLYRGAPTVTAANGTNSIQVTWSKEAGATGYMLQRKVSGETAWTTIARYTSGATVSYTETAPVSGKTYYYAVRAYYGDVKNLATDNDFTSNLWSGCTVADGLVCLSVPTLGASCAMTETGLKVTWSKVTGAAGYRVYRKTANSGWGRITDITNGSTVAYIDTDQLVSGTTYYYTVRAVAADQTTLSSFDNEGSYGVYLPAPTLVSAVVNSSKGTTLTWKAVNGADGYCVYRKSVNGSWQRLTTTTSGSVVTYLDTAVKSNNTTYYYTVKAYQQIQVDGETVTCYGAYNTEGITFSITMSGSGWVKKDGNTYYVKDGLALVGWQYLSRNGGTYKYYFDTKTGALVTNLYSYFGKSYRNLKCRIVVCLNSDDSNPSYNTIYLYDSETDSYCIPAVSVRCVGNLSKTTYKNNTTKNAYLRAGTGQRWLDSGSFEQYATYISGTYSWFHSALYYGSKSPYSFSSASYNSLVNNNNSSNGCVRMQCIYAFLIQDIMKYGYGKSNRVNVTLNKRTSQPGPFGVPKVDKISSRNSDPTDPAVTKKFFYDTSMYDFSCKSGASAWTYY